MTLQVQRAKRYRARTGIKLPQRHGTLYLPNFQDLGRPVSVGGVWGGGGVVPFASRSIQLLHAAFMLNTGKLSALAIYHAAPTCLSAGGPGRQRYSYLGLRPFFEWYWRDSDAAATIGTGLRSGFSQTWGLFFSDGLNAKSGFLP